MNDRLLRVLVVVLAVAAVLLHSRLAPRLAYDGENTVDEADGLYALDNVRRGAPLYRDFSQPPHVLTPYLPLFYYVPGTAARWLNLERAGGWLAGRAYIYLGWLSVAGLIYLLARQAGASRWAGSLAGLLWLAGGVATANAVAYRPDAVALALSLAAVWMYPRNRAAAVGLLVAAFLHRHAAVAPLAALAGWELSRREYRRGIGLIVGWAAALTVIVGWLAWTTNGALLQNVWGPLGAWSDAGRMWTLLGLALVGGLAGFGGGVLALARGEGGLLRSYFVWALVVAVVTSVKFGAGVNYYLEPFAVGCVLTGVVVERGRAMAVAVAALVVAQLGWARPAIAPPPTPRPWAVIAKQLAQWPDPLLIEDGYLAVRCGRAPVILNASMFGALQRAGRFDDGKIVEQIRAGKFGAVVTVAPVEERRRFRQFPAAWLDAVGGRYRLVATGLPVCVYAPAEVDAQQPHAEHR